MANNTFDNTAKSANKATSALTTLAAAINSLNAAVSTAMLAGFSEEITKLATALSSLSASTKGIRATANSLAAMGEAIKGLKEVKFTGIGSKIKAFVDSMEILKTVNVGDTNGLNSLIRSLLKLPQLMKEINSIDQKQLDEFVAKIKILIVQLGPLNSQLGNVISLFKVFPDAMKKSSGAGLNLTNVFGKMNSKFLNMKKIMGGVGLLYLFRKLNKVFSEAFNVSNNFTETLNLFAVSMGSNAEAGKKVVDTWSDVLGLDPGKLMERWGSMNLLLKGFGDNSEEWQNAAYGMSRNLTQLAYDMGSLYDVDPSIAFTKLQSGMSGMSRPLRAWGIDISQIALAEFALEKGITKSVQRMTQSEKAQLRYMLIMNKTAKEQMGVQGDLAKTITTPGNALRILRDELLKLKRSLGDFITPIVSEFIPYVRAFVSGLTSMFKTLSERLNDVLGFKPQSLEDFAQKVVASGDAASDTEDEIEDLTASVYGLVNGIDKFNVLSKGSGDSIKIGGNFLEDDSLEQYDFLGGLKDKITEAEAKLVPFFKKLTENVWEFVDMVSRIDHPIQKAIKALKVLIGIKIVLWVGQAVIGFSNLITAVKALKVQFLLLSEQLKTIVLTAFKKVATFIHAFFMEISFGTASLTALAGAFAVLVAGIIIFDRLSSKMTKWQKIITIFTALAIAVTAAAIAFNVLKSGPMGAVTAFAIAGGVALAGGAIISTTSNANRTKFADGGFPDRGSLFIANEQGPEWVGKSGKSTAVVNDSQMSDIMYGAVKDGVIDAMLTNDRAGTSGKDISFNFNGLNSNELARVMCGPIITEFNRRGYKVQKA